MVADQCPCTSLITVGYVISSDRKCYVTLPTNIVQLVAISRAKVLHTKWNVVV